MEEINFKAEFEKGFDVDRLTELVKERPVIWDSTVEGYRDGNATTHAWQEICSIMIDQYDLFVAEWKQYIEEIVKDIWRKTKETWEWKNRQIIAAMKKGKPYRHVLKNPARYEKLKFLVKVYDEDNRLMKNKGNGKIVLQNSGIVDPDAETVLNTFNDCTSNAGVSADDKRSRRHNLTLSSSKKRKSDNVTVMNFKPNQNQVKYSNLGGATEALSIIPNKLARTSSIEVRETEQFKSPAQVQLQRSEQILPITIETEILPSSGDLHLNTDAHVVKFVNVTRKLTQEGNSLSQLIELEANTRPSTSTENQANFEVVEKTDVDVPSGKVNVSQTPQKRPAQEDDSVNEKLYNLSQILKHWFKDLSDSQKLDFLIETLTLIKNIAQRK